MQAMLLVLSDASAKSPRRAPGTVTSMFVVSAASIPFFRGAV
jgi:hypothetical protein